MKSQHVTVNDLPPGFVAAEKGGVVRIAELQSQGYLYLRPQELPPVTKLRWNSR